MFLGVVLTLVFSVSASAQVTEGKRNHHQREVRSYRHGDLNRYESKRLHHDELRHKAARRRSFHDGRMSPYERRHLSKMRRHERRELHRFRHNRSHRHVI
jgi:hypothetical protein